MKATDLIRFQLEASKSLVTGLLADMKDAPLTQPTPNGGNHPWWIAGHLVYSEANLTTHILMGTPNPLVEWKDLFARGSSPSEDGAGYPPFDNILSRWNEVRSNTVKILDSLSDDDLDKPSANPPEGREEFFGTYGKVFSAVCLHAMMHRGQVADARRAARRKPLMA